MMRSTRMVVAVVVLLASVAAVPASAAASTPRPGEVVAERGNLLGSKTVVATEDGVDVEYNGLWKLKAFRPNSLTVKSVSPLGLEGTENWPKDGVLSPGGTLEISTTYDNDWTGAADYSVVVWVTDSGGNVVYGSKDYSIPRIARHSAASDTELMQVVRVWTDPYVANPDPTHSPHYSSQQIYLESEHLAEFAENIPAPSSEGTYTVHMVAIKIYQWTDDGHTDGSVSVDFEVAETPTPTATPTPTETATPPGESVSSFLADVWSYVQGLLGLGTAGTG